MSKFLLTGIALFALVLLGFRFQSFYASQPVYVDAEVVSLHVTLQETPEFSNKGQKFRIKTKTNQYIHVTTTAFPVYHFGEVLQIEGTIEARDLETHTIYVMIKPEITVLSEAQNPLMGAAGSLRRDVQALYEDALPPISASLLMGIIFGSREHFPDDFWEALQVTGVMHVIAASGMNVTFVSAALLFTFGRIMRRQVALLLGMVGIVFYLFLVGFEPSILRASIMGLLAFGASLLGKQHYAVYAILVTAYGMLFWQPSYINDVGFQLSFLATLGIIFLKPLFPIRENAFTEAITTTLAAQLGTLPILFGVFGQVGLVSLLVNAITLWTIPVIMLFGSIGGIIGLFIPFLGKLLLFGTIPFLSYFAAVVQFFGGYAGLIVFDSWHWTLTVGYYLLLLSWLLFKKPKQQALSLEESLSIDRY